MCTEINFAGMEEIEALAKMDTPNSGEDERCCEVGIVWVFDLVNTLPDKKVS